MKIINYNYCYNNCYVFQGANSIIYSLQSTIRILCSMYRGGTVKSSEFIPLYSIYYNIMFSHSIITSLIYINNILNAIGIKIYQSLIFILNQIK